MRSVTDRSCVRHCAIPGLEKTLVEVPVGQFESVRASHGIARRSLPKSKTGCKRLVQVDVEDLNGVAGQGVGEGGLRSLAKGLGKRLLSVRCQRQLNAGLASSGDGRL